MTEPAEVAAVDGAPPVASVIVPVRNPGAYLQQLLEALARQTIPVTRFEVIVADDGSTDGAVERAATGRPWLRVSRGTPRSSYAARNRAASLAAAPVLAFCDADCVPRSDWLENGIHALDRAELVAGHIQFDVPPRRTIWTLLDMDSFLDQESAVKGGNAVTANLFLRRELFEAAGGFDESLPEHGDYELVARCVDRGARLRFERGVVVRHPTRDEARAFLRKVWVMNYWYAARESRARRVPFRLRWRSLVPFVQPYRSRRFVGKPIVLDRRRLGENGVQPHLVDNLRAVPMLFLVLPYFASAAQLRGWLLGRRLRG